MGSQIALSYTLSRGQEIPSFPSRGKVDIYKAMIALVAGYHLLLSDSAEDAVDSLAAHLAARSALAQLHP